MKFCSLASGSKGNCHLLQTAESKILIDIGLSLKDLTARLERISLTPDQIDAVIITHEHSDHIKGLGVFSRKIGADIYLNYPTLKSAESKLGKVRNLHEFDSAEPFRINELEISPFSVSHDAADPVGFTITADDKKAGLATDMGIVTNLVRNALSDCDILLVESNHDYEQLMNGPYPWHLKQRIRSRHGHLSNVDAFELINEIVTEKTRHIVVGHLSETNNNESHVYRDLIEPYKSNENSDLLFVIANQYRPAAVVGV